MCSLEWLGRLKCRATGFDASLSSFSTSRRCSRNRSPSRVPVSPIYSFLHNVQVMQYCITCTLCKKLYIGETGRRRPEATDAENTYATLRKMTKAHRNQSRGILISLIISKNTCLFAAFPYIRVPQTAAKTQSKDLFFKSAPFIPTPSTDAFHSFNLLLLFV